ncbi:MAG: UDP-3-O-acyl-N-acetylglucosamine deacetylase [Pseudomonadota bacterium]
MRYTLVRTATFSGVGLHSGARITMRVAPAPAGAGIVFNRSDVPAGFGIVRARYDQVADTQLCTKLANAHGVSVGTVEHLMAALGGCGIHDATITLDGPEVPVMDGSSRAFVARFAAIGVRPVGPAPQAVRILAPVCVESEGRRASLTPAEGIEGLEIRFAIDFADAAVGRQDVRLAMVGDAFARELAECRTFGRLAEVESLRRLGLARGGSLDNAVVIDGGRVLNPGGLRRPDEFVRHKALDALGDLTLASAPIIGVYHGHKAGHEMTNRLLRALFDRPEAWTMVPQPAAGALRLPDWRSVAMADEERLAV